MHDNIFIGTRNSIQYSLDMWEQAKKYARSARIVVVPSITVCLAWTNGIILFLIRVPFCLLFTNSTNGFSNMATFLPSNHDMMKTLKNLIFHTSRFRWGKCVSQQSSQTSGRWVQGKSLFKIFQENLNKTGFIQIRLAAQVLCCVGWGFDLCATLYSVHCTYMTLIRVFYLTNFHFKTIPNKIGHWPILLSSLDESFLHFSIKQQSNEQNEMSSCTWCGERARTKPTKTTKLWMPILVRVNNILMCISCPNSIQITWSNGGKTIKFVLNRNKYANASNAKKKKAKSRSTNTN